jgi:hypothetical protein
MKLALEQVYVSKKGSTLGKLPALLLGRPENGILIRTCNKAGCPVPVGTTRSCDMDVRQTSKFVEVESTSEEDDALAQLSSRLGNWDAFYEISNPDGVDPLFVRYKEFFPSLFATV